jgi:PhzF family phenazine biosynthesis protein
MNLEYRVVDAFASQPFQGNPAAVVLQADALTDSQMQQLAAEFNLSETAFVLRTTPGINEPAIRLRWFTPQCEVSFCGHATLAAVHAFCEQAQESPSQLGIQCAAGNLGVRIDATQAATRRYWLSMPRPDITLAPDTIAQLLESLQLQNRANGIVSAHRTRDRDLILFMSDGKLLCEMRPDMSRLESYCLQHDTRGVCVASTDSGDLTVACISRFFAPAAGIAEDPVTGSVHGPLTALLIGGSHISPIEPGRWSFLCRQVPRNGRVGNVHVRAELLDTSLAVEIGGACVTVMSGRIAI